ncbi:MAG: polyprenyl synthetase family protein [Labilithrix sp.]|nr:polyprenyl synthetase family protein [Labilithrix sp.]
MSRSSFAVHLDAVRRRVDDDLARWLAPRVASAHAVSAEVGAAAEAVSGLAIRGGKRMRAALVAAGFAACDGAPSALDAAAPAMIAIELLQVYLLIHDDWMDDDDVRRGGPAVHVALRERLGSKALGDAAAVLAGDLACGYAQEALLESRVGADRVLAAARAFAKIQEDVVTGQLAEMSWTAPLSAKGASAQRPAADGRAPTVETIHALKTASYTVTGPLAIGACLAGASDARVAQLTRYGRPLGIAFQLRDDLLGVFGDASAMGKPVGNDVRQGKRTALVAEMRGDARCEALLSRTLGNAAATDADVAEIVAAMETSGAKARVEARVAELLAEARVALGALGLADESPAKAWLEGAISALGERAS